MGENDRSLHPNDHTSILPSITQFDFTSCNSGARYPAYHQWVHHHHTRGPVHSISSTNHEPHHGAEIVSYRAMNSSFFLQCQCFLSGIDCPHERGCTAKIN